MKHSLFVLAVIGFGLASCERHEWKSENGKPGTEELFKHESKEEKEPTSEGDEEEVGHSDSETDQQGRQHGGAVITRVHGGGEHH